VFEGGSLLQSIHLLKDEQVDLAISPWQIMFASEGDFDSKVIDKFKFIFCCHKDLLAPFGVTEGNQVSRDILQQIPQIMPTELAFNIKPESIVKPISSTFVKTRDYLTYQYALYAKLGWGPITESFWLQQMREDFIAFKPDDMGVEISGDICIVKNRNRFLGPVSRAIWEAF
jgi:DNA-binding transcriptional LysR family regulator